MILLQCNVCGGDIELSENGATGQCKFCHNKFYFKDVKNDYLINELNKANAFLRNNDFDSAIILYESLRKSFPNDAEVLWGSLMSKYGIVDVIDDRSGMIVPTCSRLIKESIFSDPLYLKALENAAPTQRKEYERRAKIIDRLEKNIFYNYQQEEDYDVFISFKARNANGELTEEAIIARNIYDELTARGFKTFFSEISLQGRIGEDFEPIIFRALYSCKFFILIATSEENLNAVWVKNEWTRFRDRIKAENLSKCTCVVYNSYLIDINAFDLAFRRNQGIDLSKYPVGGYEKILADGLSKALGKNIKEAENYEEKIRKANEETKKLLDRAEKVAKSNKSTNSVNNLYQNTKTAGLRFFENKAFLDAKAKFSEAINYNPEDSELIFLCYLADQLNSSDDPLWIACHRIVKAIQELKNTNLAQSEISKKIILYTIDVINSSIFYIKKMYSEAKNSQNINYGYSDLAKKIKDDTISLYDILVEIVRYDNFDAKDDSLFKYINGILNILLQVESFYTDLKHRLRGYYSQDEIDNLEKIFSNVQLEHKYRTAVGFMLSGAFLKAANAFHEIQNYKDSSKLYKECYIKAIPERYKIAVDNYNNKKYDTAKKEFEQFQNYLDSASYLEKINEALNARTYNKATKLFNEKKYNEALEIYNTIAHYKDSDEKIKTCEKEIDVATKLYTKKVNLITKVGFIFCALLSCGLIGFYIYGIANYKSFYQNVHFGLGIGLIFITLVVAGAFSIFMLKYGKKLYFIAVIALFGLCLVFNITALIIPSTKTTHLEQSSELILLKNCPYGNYVLENDIYVKDEVNIGLFSGTFDGNGYYLENLNLSEKYWIKKNTGEIKNLSIKNSTFGNNLVKNNRSLISELTFDNVILNSCLFDKYKAGSFSGATFLNSTINDVIFKIFKEELQSVHFDNCVLNSPIIEKYSPFIGSLFYGDKDITISGLTIHNSQVNGYIVRDELESIKDVYIENSELNGSMIFNCIGEASDIIVKNTTINYNGIEAESVGFFTNLGGVDSNSFHDVYFENVNINIDSESEIRYFGGIVGDYSIGNNIYNIGVKNMSLNFAQEFEADVVGGIIGHLNLVNGEQIFDSCFVDNLSIKIYSTKSGSGYLPSIGGLIGGIDQDSSLEARITNCYTKDMQIYGNYPKGTYISLMVGSIPNYVFNMEHCFSTVLVDEGNYGEENALCGILGRKGNKSWHDKPSVNLNYIYSDIEDFEGSFKNENNYNADTASIIEDEIMSLLNLDSSKWAMTDAGPILIWATDM